MEARCSRLALSLAILLVLMLPASASADRSVYVSNSGHLSGNGSLAAFNGDEGALTTLAGSPLAAGEDVNGVAVSPDARHVYVANTGDDTIARYKIAADGTLSALGDTPVGGNQPTGLGFTPDGEFLLATNRDSTEAAPSVSVFSVAADTGALTLVPSSPVGVGINDPRAVVVSPDGRFVYVTGRRGPVGPPPTNADSAIAALTISPDGSLHAITGSPLYIPAQVNSFGASITPDGEHMYVAQSNGDKIHGLDLNPTTGAPTVMTGSPFQAAGDSPVELAVEPDGEQLWVSEAFGKSVEGFAIDPTTGALTQDVDPVILAGQAFGIAVSPDAAFLYDALLANPGAVEGFSVDGLSLLPLDGTPFPTGGAFPNFFSVAITPTQTPKAKFETAGGKADKPLPFDASRTKVTGGFPTRFDWDFGDGSTLGDGGPTPKHVFPKDGTYEVELTVTNDCASDAVFTDGVASVGSAVYCNGPTTGTVTHEVTVDSKVDGKLSTKRTQKQKPGKVVVRAKVKAGEQLTATLKGKIKQGGKSFALRRKTKDVGAGKRKKLKLKPSKKKTRKLAAALAEGKNAKATLRGKLVDQFGNTSKTRLKVKLVAKR
jgi:DNA-binding beta-propeller fold protein YncE